MPAIISLFYLVFGFFYLQEKLGSQNFSSGFLLFLSLNILQHNPLLIFIYCLFIIIATIIIGRINTSKAKKEVFYFSMPCWLLILSVIINLMNK